MLKSKLLLFLTLWGSIMVSGQIRITEIMYNPPEPGIDTLEFIEIQNLGLLPQNLSGYSFSEGPSFTFPDVTLSSGEYLIICRDEAYFQNLFGPLPVLQWTSGALSNSGMTITLIDGSGNLVTTVSYTNAAPWPGGNANGQGASIVLCDQGAGQDDPTNWKSATTPTGIFHYGQELFTNPLSASECQSVSGKSFLISGVFDAQPAGAGAKGVELYVLEDIPNLGIYGIGSANNGGGSDGVEFTFPAVQVSKGDYIYVAADSALFAEFFGFNADFVSGAMNINGDDAIELFEVGEVIDVFGDINIDGTDQPWEYLDGWAYRINGTGPDSSIFMLGHWVFSGVGGLVGGATNNQCPVPFPLGTYSPEIGTNLKALNDFYEIDMDVTSDLDVQSNDVLPEPVTDFYLVVQPMNGQAFIANNLVTYTPDAGFCGPDQLSYGICDATGCDTAIVNINVVCAGSFPLYPIGLVRTVNANGVLDSFGITCALEGVVYGVNLRNTGLQFTIIDDQNDGIAVFTPMDLGYTVNEGDRVLLKGTIAQFNGLAQMQPVEVNLISQQNPLFDPTVVTDLNESTESQLIRFTSVSIVDPADWTNSGTGFNVRVTDGVNTFSMRIDDNVDLYGTDPPTGAFQLTGLGTQFDSSEPYDDGYQIMPRSQADISKIVSNEVALSNDVHVRIWPNPSNGMIQFEMTSDFKRVELFNVLGQKVWLSELPGQGHTSTSIDLTQLPMGHYQIVFYTINNTPVVNRITLTK
jgi:hypothetical protein